MKVIRYIHVNVVCADLEQSLGFYVDTLGGEVHEAFHSGESDLREAMGVDATGAPGYRAALVCFGGARGGPYIDLVEWVGGDLSDRRRPLQAQDFGLARVALEVEGSLDDWQTRLERAEVPLVGPIQDDRVGPWPVRLLFCLDPDGTLIELVEFPRGQARQYQDRALTV